MVEIFTFFIILLVGGFVAALVVCGATFGALILAFPLALLARLFRL